MYESELHTIKATYKTVVLFKKDNAISNDRTVKQVAYILTMYIQ